MESGLQGFHFLAGISQFHSVFQNADPYADPYAETSGWKQWTGLLQRATPSGQNSAKRIQKHRFYFHPNLHTQEVTDSSSVVSTRKRLISQEIRRFCYFFGAKPYRSKSGAAQDPDRDPYADRIQWSGQHGEAFHRLPPSIIREEYYAALEVWDVRQELAPLQEFLRQKTEKRGRSGSCVRRASVRVEGVLLVLPSSCSITPPVGEEGALQWMVGGAHSGLFTFGVVGLLYLLESQKSLVDRILYRAFSLPGFHNTHWHLESIFHAAPRFLAPTKHVLVGRTEFLPCFQNDSGTSSGAKYHEPTL